MRQGGNKAKGGGTGVDGGGKILGQGVWLVIRT